jgi:calcium-dependent protein kinase
VWSVGVIAYMLLSGIPPFYGTTDSETLVSIKTGEWQFDEYLFNSVSPEAKDFISKCLTRRPFWRPSAASALKHKWFKSMLPRREPLPSINIIHRFSTFIVRPTLSKIFMDVVAHTLLPEQVTELREQFNKFDVSNSGAITLQDLRAIMRQFKGFREDYLNVIIASLDLDQKGKIGYHEFLAATIRRQNVAEENLQIAFEIVSNHSEYITSADVAALLGGSNFELGHIMEEAGLDLDAKISFHGVSVTVCLVIARALCTVLCVGP